MTRIANTAGVFGTFAYGFDDPNGYVQTLPKTTQEHLEKMPPLIAEWQAQDIAANTVGDYYHNPMDNLTVAIKANTIILRNSSNNVAALSTLRSKAVTLISSTDLFLQHTDRLSGVTPYTGQDSVNPYLDLAMNLGKTALYIVNQTDGIVNNAPIMGSFTSILVGPQLKANSETLQIYSGMVANSITANTVTTQVDDGNGGYTYETTTTYTTNLSSQMITTISNEIEGISTFINVRRIEDLEFYNNMKSFIDKYNQVKKFNKMGATETDMVQNLIGSQKLLDRLNS